MGEKAISEKTIRKKLSFARAGAAISRAGHRLTTPKGSPKKLDHLQQLVDEHEQEQERPFSTIFSSPSLPELDNRGKQACVRYIADFDCGHQVIEQHPCQEHYPACCLDDGHFVTKKIEKAKMCQDCQNIEKTMKLEAKAHADALEQWNNAKQQIQYPTSRCPSVSPQRRRALAIKERVARKIEALGPLPPSSTSDLHTEGNDNDKFTDTVYDFREALQELEPDSGDEATTPNNHIKRSISQTTKERLGPFVAAEISLKGYPTANSRAVSGSGMLGAGQEGYRSVSESLRPSPPLPTPVNFDANAMADKAYENSFHGSFQEDSQSLATTAEDRNYEEHEVYGTPPMHDDDEQSFIFNGEDDYESTLSTQDNNSVLASDPFLGDDRREMRASLAGPSERPLPPIPADATRRHSIPSAEDEHELGFSTKSLQYWKDLDIPPPLQHSPTRPRQAPAVPSPPTTPPPSVVPTPPAAVNRLAAFDFNFIAPAAPTPPTVVDPLSLFDFGFEKEYSRGGSGYVGRMGQKGAGDDFNHEWKFEHSTRDYIQDETATGDLWENKHGFGYAGLKRHLQKQAEMRKQKENEESKQDESGKENKNGKKRSPNKRFSGESFSYSSPRPNKESSIWARRCVKKEGFPMPAPMLYVAAGTGEVGVDQKGVADPKTIVKNAKKETYDGIPWDRTMIGCAL